MIMTHLQASIRGHQARLLSSSELLVQCALCQPLLAGAFFKGGNGDPFTPKYWQRWCQRCQWGLVAEGVVDDTEVGVEPLSNGSSNFW